MRALAEFIMRGRLQASAVALVGSVVPFLSPATVGLVTLRKGGSEAFIVALWSAMPIVVSYHIGQTSPFLAVISVASLVHVIAVATVLKVTRAWTLSLLVLIALGVVLAGLARIVFQADFATLLSDLDEIFQAASKQLDESLDSPSASSILAAMGWIIALSSLVGLVLARWWQALLFNPGGFQEEFHNIRLDKKSAAVCVMLVCAGLSVLADYQLWLQLAIIPLLVGGLSVLHCAVKLKGFGSHWLVLVYVGLLLGPFTPGLLAAVGAADSVLNLRARLSGNSGT